MRRAAQSEAAVARKMQLTKSDDVYDFLNKINAIIFFLFFLSRAAGPPSVPLYTWVQWVWPPWTEVMGIGPIMGEVRGFIEVF